MKEPPIIAVRRKDRRMVALPLSLFIAFFVIGVSHLSKPIRLTPEEEGYKDGFAAARSARAARMEGGTPSFQVNDWEQAKDGGLVYAAREDQQAYINGWYRGFGDGQDP